jgi:uncharacterized protein (DUF1501 family)
MTNRRNFLKGMSAASFFAGTNLAFFAMSPSAMAADTTGYKALVCVFLYGGMDCHDTILPYDQASYDRYAEIRAALLEDYAAAPGGSTRDRDALLPLTLANAGDFGSRQFALPPQFSAIHSLFQSGQAAIIGNVGPLLAPLDAAGFEDEGTAKPKKLFSHNDQQSTWMAFEPEGAPFGWGGLFGDAAIASNANDNDVFTAITVAGNEVFLSGETARPYQIGVDGVQQIALIDEDAIQFPEEIDTLLRAHFEDAQTARSNLFQRDFVTESRRSLEANDVINAALMGSPTNLTTAFPQSSLGQQLRAVADTINIRSALGAGRQIFFVATGGFDTHSGQAGALPNLQQDISDSINAFYNATIEMGIANDVTTFTASDFGRTLIINGDGTDHGWGAHHFAVGGAVNGGAVYGDIPPYDLGHSQDAGNGRLIPSVAVEQYAAAMGRWFGLTTDELNQAMPLLSQFPAGPLNFI